MLKAHWSQPAATMSAAVAAGRLPPITNPKNRGPALDMRPGSAASTSCSRTSAGVDASCGRGPPRASQSPAIPALGETGRSARLAR